MGQQPHETAELEPRGELTIAELRYSLEHTGLRRDMIRVLEAGKEYSGQEVKELLERHYGDVNHGRLYPNLDKLVDTGMLEKGQRDRRTNTYEITDKAVQFINYVNEMGEEQ